MPGVFVFLEPLSTPSSFRLFCAPTQGRERYALSRLAGNPRLIIPASQGVYDDKPLTPFK